MMLMLMIMVMDGGTHQRLKDSHDRRFADFPLLDSSRKFYKGSFYFITPSCSVSFPQLLS